VISCFLNPSGKALIILVEDKKRDVRIDHLEMQYYRFLLSQHELEDHLESAEGRIRYSNTCRDISSVIQQDFVAVTSGIASKVIKETIQRDDARIIIWKIDSEMAIRKYEAVSAKTIRQNLGEWTIITDQLFLDKMSKFRKERLPNETGGVLIGSFDLNTKTVYVVDTILSPSDSKEWPTSYIRGCEGLQSEVDRIKKVTSNNLEYIGEWHSHPDGYGCSPSQDDRKALKLLNGLMFTEGLPGMMVIVGDKDSFGFYINQM